VAADHDLCRWLSPPTFFRVLTLLRPLEEEWARESGLPTLRVRVFAG